MADIKTDELITCECGSKPDHYSIEYGRTPYMVVCPGCKKQTNRYRQIGGLADNIIKFWNEIALLKETCKWIDNSLSEIDEKPELKYEVAGKSYTYREVRRAILEEHDNKNYNVPVYMLFVNGKITCDDKQFMIRGVDY